MAEEDDVAFLDDVVAAFEANFALFAGMCEASGGEQVFAAHNFGADETFFDVAVDFAGGFDGGGASADGPGAGFRVANGEKRDETQKIVGRVDEPYDAKLGEADGVDEFGGINIYI